MSAGAALGRASIDSVDSAHASRAERRGPSPELAADWLGDIGDMRADDPDERAVKLNWMLANGLLGMPSETCIHISDSGMRPRDCNFFICGNLRAEAVMQR